MRNSANTRRYRAALVSFALVALSGALHGSNEKHGSLTSEDVKAIQATIESYRTTWLATDAKGVLKTFTDDAVVMPAHGAAAVVGIDAIEKYWFSPGGPATTITQLEISVDEVSGNGTLAFARGSNRVGWTITQDGTTHRHFHAGSYLDVLKKMADGSWRIQVHMWDDGPERVE